MRLQKIKLFSGMSLSVMLSLAAVFPAIAHHTPEHGKGQAISQMTNIDQRVTGRIKSIVGNVVTLELADGTTTDIMISRAERERLGLRPGMEIATMMQDGNLMVEVVNANAASSTSSSEANMNTTTESSASSNEANMSTTTGRRVVEETTIRRRTTVSPVVEQSTEQTSGDVQQSSQVVEENTETTVTEERSQPAKPVRALW